VLFTKSELQLYFRVQKRTNLARARATYQIPMIFCWTIFWYVRFGKVNASFGAGRREGKLEVMNARQAKLLFFGLIVLVTLLFFLHVPSGGFQAQNGPTTPENNLRLALIGLLLLLDAGVISVSVDTSLNSVMGHVSPVFLHFPAASNGISLRC